MHKNKGNWYSILDYATLKKISISTVRRHIRAGRVKYKFERGKYFIFSSEFNQNLSISKVSTRENMSLKLEVERLSALVRKKDEELCELRMLVSLYEHEKASMKTPDLPPELPVVK